MGVTATHTYATEGTYTITLTVTDDDAQTGTATHDVVASPLAAPVASFTASVDWLVVSVDGSGSFDSDGTIVSYAWDFGDGAVAAGKTATHTYAAGGTYTITLTVTDNDGLTGSAMKDVNVRPAIPPTASFTATADWLVVSVDGSASSDVDGTIVSYAWNFGDGAVGSGKTATHTYAAGGTYTITLTVTDNDGLADSDAKSVTVRPAIPPVASFTTSIDWLVVSVDASASSDADGSIVSYAWDFGDGAVAAGKTATHTYAAGGTYSIGLTVTDNDGLTGSDAKSVTVRPAIPPTASFTATAAWLVVSVDGSGSSDADGTIASYAWNFGDGAVATGKTATHTYAAGGTYTITLTVTDNDGLTDSDAKSVTVRPAIPPVAAISATTTFLDVSVSGAGSSDADGTIVSYAWNFGDGATASGVTATHTYAAQGIFTITLTVTDNDGLTGIATKDVSVRPPNPPVASYTYSVDGPLLMVDASGSSAEAGIASYTWNWGDGSAPEVTTSVLATHTYSAGVAAPVIAKSVAVDSVIIDQGPPPPPYTVFGYVTDSSGAPVFGASVVVQDLVSGTSWTTTTDFEYGYYLVDLNMYYPSPVGWKAGDTIQVTVTLGSLSGSGTGIAGAAGNEAYLWLDIVVHSSGPSPHDVTVMLTVTDLLGRTSSTSQTVTVYY
jgi:PKD repeat protein